MPSKMSAPDSTKQKDAIEKRITRFAWVLLIVGVWLLFGGWAPGKIKFDELPSLIDTINHLLVAGVLLASGFSVLRRSKFIYPLLRIAVIVLGFNFLLQTFVLVQLYNSTAILLPTTVTAIGLMLAYPIITILLHNLLLILLVGLLIIYIARNNKFLRQVDVQNVYLSKNKK